MDFGRAALLISAVYGITELVKAVLPDLSARLTALVSIAVGFAATFLVAATTWAHTVVIGEQELAHMSVADKVLVSIFVAGAAGLAHRVIGTVSNIGAPMPSKAQQDAIDTGALASMERWAQLDAPHGGDEA